MRGPLDFHEAIVQIRRYDARQSVGISSFSPDLLTGVFPTVPRIGFLAMGGAAKALISVLDSYLSGRSHWRELIMDECLRARDMGLARDILRRRFAVSFFSRQFLQSSGVCLTMREKVSEPPPPHFLFEIPLIRGFLSGPRFHWKFREWRRPPPPIPPIRMAACDGHFPLAPNLDAF